MKNIIGIIIIIIILSIIIFFKNKLRYESCFILKDFYEWVADNHTDIFIEYFEPRDEQ